MITSWLYDGLGKVTRQTDPTGVDTCTSGRSWCQGNPFDHTIHPILCGEFPDLAWPPFLPLGNVVRFNPRHWKHDQWAERFARDWFGGVPSGLHWVVGAQFAVHRRLMLNRSLDYWKALQRKILDEEETSPWAMERLWMAVL